MKFFVSITFCLLLSIGDSQSQQSSIFNYFQQQPKALRDGFYQQEVVYTGPGGQQQNYVFVPLNSQQKPNLHPIQNRPHLPQNIRFTSIPADSPAPLVPSADRPSVSIPPQPKGMPLNVPAAVNVPTLPVIPPLPQLPITTTTERIEIRPRIALPPATTTSTTPRITTTTESLTSEELQEQAKSAYYNFETSVHDSINDHSNVRTETREGLALKGMYSYSDGFFKRTVHYEADEDGYRVVNESVEPLNTEGPKFNPKGKADVSSSLTGDYSIGIQDFRLTKEQLELVEKEKENNSNL